MVALVFISAWVSLPLIFSTHGIFTYRQPFRVSLANSIQLGRYAGPQIATFAVVILILGTGLNYLWSIPEADDWLLSIGIAGHAFVSTALLAGSFILLSLCHALGAGDHPASAGCAKAVCLMIFRFTQVRPKLRVKII